MPSQAGLHGRCSHIARLRTIEVWLRRREPSLHNRNTRVQTPDSRGVASAPHRFVQHGVVLSKHATLQLSMVSWLNS